MMPEQKPGKSKQDYGTPVELIKAIERRFGHLSIDLAATEANKKAPACITPERNSLTSPWPMAGNLWLNPPFANIDPWAEKCAAWSQALARSKSARLFLLTPASIGANWFANHVHDRARVEALQGRLIFEGETAPYPKDCMISIFGDVLPGFDVWKWKE